MTLYCFRDMTTGMAVSEVGTFSWICEQADTGFADPVWIRPDVSSVRSDVYLALGIEPSLVVKMPRGATSLVEARSRKFLEIG